MRFPFNGNGRFQATQKRLYTVYLPLTRNDGSVQPSRLLQQAEEGLVQLAGGLAWFHPGLGLWVPSPQARILRDRIAPVHVVADIGPEAETQMTDLVAQITADFEQDQLFVFVQEVWVVEPIPAATNGVERQPLPVSN